MKTLIASLLLASCALAQYAPSASGSATAAAEINGKINHREGSGAPSANCTLGKDVYTDTATGNLYLCTATNTWTLQVSTADSRLTNSRAPSGSAGGGLTGTYPNPTLANPSSTTLGGVQSAAAQSGKVIDSISTSGVPNVRSLVSADIPNNAASTSGNAATASALAALPTLCTGGQVATGILANGNATGCTTPSGSGLTTNIATVTFSATPTFTVVASTSIQHFFISLTGNVTSSTLVTTNATSGQDISFNICQDSTGSRTFVWPANVTGGGTIQGQLSTCSRQIFRWDGTNAIAITPMTCPICTGGITIPGSTSGSTTVQATAAASGTLTLPAATDTLVGRATTDTLTNKTFVAPVLGAATATSINGLAIPSTLTNHGVVVGQAAAAPGATSAGTAGQVLTSNGASADPTFQAAAGGVGSSSSGQVLANTSGAVTGITRSGNGNVASASGTLTNGHCVSIDASGNFVDAGGACTVGGGGGTVSSATSGQIAYYASTGTVVSGGSLTGDVSQTALATKVIQIHNTVTAVNNAASPYTVLAADTYITCDATAGAVVLTLPATSGSGREITVKKIDSSANACTPTRAGSDVIDSATTVSLTSQWATAKIIDRATGFWDRAHVSQLGGDVGGATSANVIAANAVTSAKMAAVNTRRTTCIPAGAKNASAALADTDLADSDVFFVPAASTVVEVTVHADAGTPNIIVGRDRAGSVVNLTSAALATAASGAVACSNTGGTTGLNTVTTCSSTLQNTGLNAGDWLLMVSGTAGGTAKQMVACVTYTIN